MVPDFFAINKSSLSLFLFKTLPGFLLKQSALLSSCSHHRFIVFKQTGLFLGARVTLQVEFGMYLMINTFKHPNVKTKICGRIHPNIILPNVILQGL